MRVFIKMRVAFLAPILPWVMKEGESKKAALLLMKNSHFNRTLRLALGSNPTFHKIELGMSGVWKWTQSDILSLFIIVWSLLIFFPSTFFLLPQTTTTRLYCITSMLELSQEPPVGALLCDPDWEADFKWSIKWSTLFLPPGGMHSLINWHLLLYSKL